MYYINLFKFGKYRILSYYIIEYKIMEYHKCVLCNEYVSEDKFQLMSKLSKNVWAVNRIKNHNLYLKFIKDCKDLSRKNLYAYMDEYFMNIHAEKFQYFNYIVKNKIMALFKCYRGGSNLFLLMIGCIYSPNSPLKLLSEDLIYDIWSDTYICHYPLYCNIKVTVTRFINDDNKSYGENTNSSCRKCIKELNDKTEELNKLLLEDN